MSKIKISDIASEVEITTSRSGGPGGQHVNKVETRVQLRWNVKNSAVLTEEQRQTLLTALAGKLTNGGELIVTAGSKRSQVGNKELAFQKLEKLLAKAFYKPKRRKATKPTKNSIKRRLDGKKKHSRKKADRRKVTTPG